MSAVVAIVGQHFVCANDEREVNGVDVGLQGLRRSPLVTILHPSNYIRQTTSAFFYRSLEPDNEDNLIGVLTNY